MTLDRAFQAIYRRGRWSHGTLLSVGVLPNPRGRVRVGLRVKRGVRHATDRNRLKRQLRHLVAGRTLPFTGGTDVLIVAHPRRVPTTTSALQQELANLCRRITRTS